MYLVDTCSGSGLPLTVRALHPMHITALALTRFWNPVHFVQGGKVHVQAEGPLNRNKVCSQSVRGELNPAVDAVGQVLHKHVSTMNVSIPHQERGHYFVSPSMATHVQTLPKPNCTFLSA